MFEKNNSSSKDNFVWAFKYKPKTLLDLILLDKQRKKFEKIIKSKSVPDTLLYGLAGVGKTTIANIFINEIGMDVLRINGSRDTSIDVVRSDIKNFTRQYSDKPKLVFIDEMEGISKPAQKSLKSEMEDCTKTSFIFTTNHKEDIIDPIVSRCGGGISFSYNNEEKKELQRKYYDRCIQILNEEQVEFEPKAVVKIIQNLFPDMRNIIHNMQDVYQQYDKIDLKGVESTLNTNLDEYFNVIKSRNFSQIRLFCANLNSDYVMFYNQIIHKIEKYIEQESIGSVINECYEHSKTASQSADKELPLVHFSMCLLDEKLK